MHGDNFHLPKSGTVIAMAPAVSAAQAIRALRGCSAEERDAVAKHVGDCAHCLAAIAGEEWLVASEYHGHPGSGARVVGRDSSLIAMGPKVFAALAAQVRDAWRRVP